ncbi:hypothetical protein [Burkholderia ambifaria]|uniref:hypothetical protein n=1 Tax=Burkholderia ambifaria TaxID=152480 RepID=UPI002FE3B11D
MRILVVSRLEVWRIGVASVLSQLLSEVEIVDVVTGTAMLQELDGSVSIDLAILDADAATEEFFRRDLASRDRRRQMPPTIILASDDAQISNWQAVLSVAHVIDKRRPLIDFADTVLNVTSDALHRRLRWSY